MHEWLTFREPFMASKNRTTFYTSVRLARLDQIKVCLPCQKSQAAFQLVQHCRHLAAMVFYFSAHDLRSLGWALVTDLTEVEMRSIDASQAWLRVELSLARDGLEGLRFVEQFDPELIFVALFMSRMDGFELCARLREKRETEDAAILGLTGCAGNEYRRSRLPSGFNAYLG